MTIFEEATEALASDPEIARAYASTSPGDRSILSMLLDTEGSVGTTTVESPNARLWLCLAGHGWMAKIEGIMQEVAIPMLHYQITDRGYRAIPVLLDKLIPRQSDS
jgi:hypothetical protein